MDDSGWYKVDMLYYDKMKWGLNRGCDFFNKACQAPTRFDEFCYHADPTAVGCTIDDNKISYCQQDQFSDFCTMNQMYTNGDCRYEENGASQDLSRTLQVFGESSKCFISSF